MSDNLIGIAKNFLSKHLHLDHLSDGNFQVDEHDSAVDSHVVDQLPGIDESHIDTEAYHVVTCNKDVIANDGAIIPRTIKIEIDKNNNVKNVLESK